VTQTLKKRPLEILLLLFKRLLDPLILEQLAARSPEVIREKKYRPGGSIDFRAVVLRKTLCPFLKFRDLIVGEQEAIISDGPVDD
jgi:hypothetical protein